MSKGNLLYITLQPAPLIVSCLYMSLLPGEAFPGPKLNEAIQKELDADHVITTTILFIDILFPDERLPSEIDDTFLAKMGQPFTTLKGVQKPMWDAGRQELWSM